MNTDDGTIDNEDLSSSNRNLPPQLSLSRSPSMRRYNEGMQRLKSTFRSYQKVALESTSDDSSMPPPPPIHQPMLNNITEGETLPSRPYPTVESLLYDVDIDEFESEDDETLNLPSLKEIDKIDNEETSKEKEPTAPKIKWKSSVRALDRPPSEIEDWNDSVQTRDKDEFQWPRKVEMDGILLKQGTKRYALGMMRKPWQRRYVCVGDGYVFFLLLLLFIFDKAVLSLSHSLSLSFPRLYIFLCLYHTHTHAHTHTCRFICWHKKKNADKPSGRLRLVHYKCSEPVRIKNS